MFPLTHLYVNQKVTGSMSPALALGSVLPDILTTLGLSWDESHALKSCDAWPEEVHQGDSLHGAGLPGLDYFTDQAWHQGPGYAFGKARHIKGRMRSLGLPEKDLVWRGHNQVEMAIEVELGKTQRPLFQFLGAALDDQLLVRQVEDAVRTLYDIHKPIAPVVEHFLHLNADLHILSEYYAHRLNTHYGLQIVPIQIEDTIEAVWDHIEMDYNDFLSDCIVLLRLQLPAVCTKEESMLTPFSQFFDHTNLKADATRADITRLCQEARQWSFYAVCIHPVHLPLARKLLEGSSVKLCTVCGFPLGANAPIIKASEAAQAVLEGAQEVDMVLNIGDVKDGRFDRVRDEIATVVQEAGPHITIKVILETGLLSDEEIKRACLACEEGGAHFVKSSTGFSNGGATAHHIALMRESVGPGMKIKASGGIRTLEDVETMIQAGANRIGASASVAIMKEYISRQQKEL